MLAFNIQRESSLGHLGESFRK